MKYTGVVRCVGLWCLITVGAAGCFSPSFEEGLPCGENNSCPDSLTCVLGRCVSGTDERDADPNNPDARAPAPDADPNCEPLVSFQPTGFDACSIPPLQAATVLSGSDIVINTTDATVDVGQGPEPFGVVMSTDQGVDALVASALEWTVANGSTLHVTGDKPLVLIAESDISILGDVWASADMATPGPGANGGHCGGGTAGVTEVPGSWSGGSGGGGGGLAAAGGDGGDVFGSAAPPAPAGGVAVVTDGPRLLGGCSGGNGGDGSANGPGGLGGGGGGAVQLSSASTIFLDAHITVSGGGGRGGAVAGNPASGGGGGGSGGSLILEANAIQGTGALTANGGGGGGASFYSNTGVNGANGSNASDAPASGGKNGYPQYYGQGGNGGAGATMPESGTSGQNIGNLGAGGGGGGGAVGFIWLVSTTNSHTGIVSPPAQP